MKRYAGLILALVLAAVPLAAQQPPKTGGTPADAKAPAKTQAAVPAPGSADPNYVIGAEDVLDVSVWEEPQFSRSVPVRPDGMISLPLINDVQAAGLTPIALGAAITEKLKKFVHDPQVTVVVTAINSRRFYVTGEVNRGGAYPLLPNMKALEGLASAGGFTMFAKQTKIYILRLENGQQVRLPFNYKDIIKGKHPEQNVYLKPGDTIVVP